MRQGARTCHHGRARAGAAGERPAGAALPDDHAHVAAVEDLCGSWGGVGVRGGAYKHPRLQAACRRVRMQEAVR